VCANCTNLELKDKAIAAINKIENNVFTIEGYAETSKSNYGMFRLAYYGLPIRVYSHMKVTDTSTGKKGMITYNCYTLRGRR
jgi:hypothetical protein